MKSRLLLVLVFVLSLGILPLHAQEPTATPLPPFDIMTPENAAQIQPIRRIGYGVVESMAWSPDGNTLGVGTTIGLLIYDATDWSDMGSDSETPAYILEGQSGVYSVAFSPDGKVVASGGADGSVFLWDVASGKQITRFQLGESHVDGLRFSPSGHLLAATDESVHLRVWDVQTHLMRFHIEEDGFQIGIFQPSLPPSLSFSPDENKIAVGWYEIAQVFSLETGLEAFNDYMLCDRFNRFTSDVSVAFMPDSDHLLYLSNCPYPMAGVLGMWKPGDELPLRKSLPQNVYDITPLRLDNLPNGDVLQYNIDTHGGNYGDVLTVGNYTENDPRLGDSENISIDSPFAWNNQKGWFAGLRAYSQKTTLYVGNWGADAEIDAATLKGFFAPAPDFVLGAEQTLLFRTDYGRYTAIDTRTGAALFTVTDSLTLPVSSPYSPDGRMLAVAGQIKIMQGYIGTYKDVIHILDAKTGVEQIMLDDVGNSTALVWSPDGRLLASGNPDGTLTVWDVISGQVVTRLRGHNLAVRGVAFNQDGSMIASSSDNGTIRLWGVPHSP